jgi:hypothetical protein
MESAILERYVEHIRTLHADAKASDHRPVTVTLWARADV